MLPGGDPGTGDRSFEFRFDSPFRTGCVKVLLDQCTPALLRPLLDKHEVHTAYEEGWDRLRNGELLSATEAAGFDLVITADKNWPSQQNLDSSRLAILVLPTNNWPKLKVRADEIVAEIDTMRPGEFREMKP